MANMSISLPDKMRSYIKSRVESGDYHNESEFIRDLIRRERAGRIATEEDLLNLLRKADASGTVEASASDIKQAAADRQTNDN